MKNIILIAIATFMLSCTNKSQQHLTSLEVKKSDAVKQANKSATKGNLDPKKNSVVQKSTKAGPSLMGDWVADESENVTFEITKNTFYYPEHSSSYRYKIVGDSVKVQYDGFDQSFAYHLDGEKKLTLVGADGEQHVYSRKK